MTVEQETIRLEDEIIRLKTEASKEWILDYLQHWGEAEETELKDAYILWAIRYDEMVERTLATLKQGRGKAGVYRYRRLMKGRR